MAKTPYGNGWRGGKVIEWGKPQKEVPTLGDPEM